MGIFKGYIKSLYSMYYIMWFQSWYKVMCVFIHAYILILIAYLHTQILDNIVYICINFLYIIIIPVCGHHDGFSLYWRRLELLLLSLSLRPVRTFTGKRNRSVGMNNISNRQWLIILPAVPKVAELTRSWTGKWFELHKIAKVFNGWCSNIYIFTMGNIL